MPILRVMAEGSFLGEDALALVGQKLDAMRAEMAEWEAQSRSTSFLAFRQAVLAELLNPKTALFFLAFLPQFVRPGHGAVILQLAILGLVFAAMSAGYTVLIALAAGWVGRWLGRHRRIGRWQGRIVGVIYLGLGVRLARSER